MVKLLCVVGMEVTLREPPYFYFIFIDFNCKKGTIHILCHTRDLLIFVTKGGWVVCGVWCHTF